VKWEGSGSFGFAAPGRRAGKKHEDQEPEPSTRDRRPGRRQSTTRSETPVRKSPTNANTGSNAKHTDSRRAPPHVRGAPTYPAGYREAASTPRKGKRPEIRHWDPILFAGKMPEPADR